MNSWWIITCISWWRWGRNQKKTPKKHFLLLLKNFCKEFSASFLLSTELKPLHNSLQGQRCWGGRMTHSKRKINLGQPELSWTCSLKTNPQAQLNQRAGQKLAKNAIFPPLQDQRDYEVLRAALTIGNQRRAQTCEEVTLAGWENSLADSQKSNFYK